MSELQFLLVCLSAWYICGLMVLIRELRHPLSPILEQMLQMMSWYQRAALWLMVFTIGPMFWLSVKLGDSCETIKQAEKVS